MGTYADIVLGGRWHNGAGKGTYHFPTRMPGYFPLVDYDIGAGDDGNRIGVGLVAELVPLNAAILMTASQQLRRTTIPRSLPSSFSCTTESAPGTTGGEQGPLPPCEQGGAYVHEQEHHMVWLGASDVVAATGLLDAVTSDAGSALTGSRNAEALISAQCIHDRNSIR